MNLLQSSAFEFVKNGHNVYIGGQAGSGKSFLTERIVSYHRSIGKNVALTCSTGIACSLYHEAMTIHKWAGLSDGRFSNSTLHELVMSDDHFQSAKQRILDTDLLIIDEVSMISLKVLDQLQYLLTHIRNVSRPYGGIQVILVGDFLQLPPVPNARYNDAGEFCFLSNAFPKHRVFLTHIMRQNDRRFCNVIRQVSLGEIDSETEKILLNLQYNVLPVDTPKLFSQNIAVDMFNRDVILRMDGELYSFESKDEGEAKYLDTLVVQKVIWLKINARVMLLRNLSDTLVNGEIGVVRSIQPGEVHVYFPRLDKVTTLSRMKFTVFDPKSSRNLATRSQLPLKLAYAMTVHKAQGMTLSGVELDCRCMFKPGQLAVALSRVQSMSCLRIINFSCKDVAKPPDTVLKFLEQESQPTLPDNSCCHVSIPVVSDTLLTTLTDDTENDFTDDQELDSYLRNLDLTGIITEIPADFPLPDDFNYIQKVTDLIFTEPCTDNQHEHNKLVRYLLANTDSLKQFISCLYSWINKIYLDNLGSVNVKQKSRNQTGFYNDFNKFATSDMYKNVCMTLFPLDCSQDVMFPLCYDMLSNLRTFYLCKHAEVLPSEDISVKYKSRCFELNDDLNATAQGKIRYVAGYVIGKLRFKSSKKVQQSAFKCDRNNMLCYEYAKRSFFLLDSFKTCENFLQNSNYSDSLGEIRRKQNLNHSLTVVTDEFFCWFTEIVSAILKLLVTDILGCNGSALYSKVKKDMSSNLDLYQKFLAMSVQYQFVEFNSYQSDEGQESVINCLNDTLTMIEVVEELYVSIVETCSKVLLKQFSNDLIESLNIKKKMEHRKQIHVSSKDKSHKCSNKKVSQLQATSPQPSTSQQIDNDMCAVCKQFYKNNEDWICCDKCSKWFHRKCAGLSNGQKWKRYHKLNVHFYCNKCE